MIKHSTASFFLVFMMVFSCLAIISDRNIIQIVYAEDEHAAVDGQDETAQITFSTEAGANIEGKTVELCAPDGYDIYYTVDGSDPTTTSAKYTEPLTLQANSSVLAAEADLICVGDFKIYEDNTLPKAVTLKAMAVSSDGAVTPVATRTYFFQNREPVIVIALSTDYSNLLDYDFGIMVKGAYYDAWANTPEAQPVLENNETWHYQGNYTQKGKDWERPATIEIFDDLYGQETYILDNCGIRLRGGASREYAQKSFNIYFKDSYGSKVLDYSLFDDARNFDGGLLTSYKGFALRNGGNDTNFLKFHDSLIQNLAKDLNVTTQAFRPAVLYLNGEYMGVYVLQEKYSDKFIADHYNVNEKNVIIVEEGKIDEGEDEDISFYEDMMSFADKNLSEAAVYNEFCNIVDIDSMIDFYAVQIYISNADWNPEKNTRIWRVRTPENDHYGDGKWRWILYDTEFSSSLHNKESTSFECDSYVRTIEEDPLFASVVKNPDFYNKFAERINYLSDNTFAPEKVSAEVDRLAALYKPFMPDYYKRFGDTSEKWDININNIKTFFENRSGVILDAVQNGQL